MFEADFMQVITYACGLDEKIIFYFQYLSLNQD